MNIHERIVYDYYTDGRMIVREMRAILKDIKMDATHLQIVLDAFQDDSKYPMKFNDWVSFCERNEILYEVRKLAGD
jgi:hypothetical protein